MIVNHGRARLAAREHGSGQPDVLLVHAGVTDQRSWSHLIGRLSTHARCLTFDARGFGRTEYEPEEGWSPVDDALAVLDGFGSARAVVVGASMGGRTALDLTLSRPDRVSGLVLIGAAISGAPAPTDLDDAARALDEAGDAALERGDLDEVNRIEAHLWLDGPLQAEGRVEGEARRLFLEMNAAALAAADPGGQADPPAAWDRLDEVGVPTLVLVGEHDLRHVRANARRVAESVRAARLIELDGVAHLPHLEGDQQTLAAIDEFVSAAASR
ncbi:alpha/beta fold hydrolase [Nocardioides terrisoli]|uniref:alpha/beta fold hydrolase n=1 Tax=Nocardioides terrisoli TaxID=3388267 RepID=UPI00287BAA7D|nr:alpha/beta hydrolase [Nocardioides marmorisolisilvae]